MVVHLVPYANRHVFWTFTFCPSQFPFFWRPKLLGDLPWSSISNWLHCWGFFGRSCKPDSKWLIALVYYIVRLCTYIYVQLYTWYSKREIHAWEHVCTYIYIYNVQIWPSVWWSPPSPPIDGDGPYIYIVYMDIKRLCKYVCIYIYIYEIPTIYHLV